MLPDEPEVLGLQALMLLHDSRRDARVRDGELVLLAEQDPALWDHAEIAAGRATLDRAIAARWRGPYVLQAAIASLHAERPCDWAQIASLYGALVDATGSAVVELNRAVAVAELDGPEVALAVVDALDLHGYRYCTRPRADLLRRLGAPTRRRSKYRRALALTEGGAEQRFLERRLAELLTQ